MLLLSSWAFEREIIEVERCDHLLARFLAYLLQFVAENYEFATHRLNRLPISHRFMLPLLQGAGT